MSGDDSDVEAGRCCPHCRELLTEHNRKVWDAGYSVGQRHANEMALEAARPARRAFADWEAKMDALRESLR